MRKASPAGSHTHSPPLWHCLSIFLHGSRVFLLRTGALYFPSVLGVINPVLLDNEYVQTRMSREFRQILETAMVLLRGRGCCMFWGAL
jgi:hypothetical protein